VPAYKTVVGQRLNQESGISTHVNADLTAEFEQMVRDHQQMVFRTLTRLTGSNDRVEDLAQEVFLRLYRALPSFRGEALVSTYLYRIAVNVAQDEWKRRRREDRPLVSISEDPEFPLEERLADPEPGALEQLTQREFAKAVDEELQRLSAVERTVLVLYQQEERSYQQIAEALHIPIGTVRTHLHRARKRLRDAIAARTGAATASSGAARPAHPVAAASVQARREVWSPTS
jgi:RNA polymerase sigma factor (sigma-70 family)